MRKLLMIVITALLVGCTPAEFSSKQKVDVMAIGDFELQIETITLFYDEDETVYVNVDEFLDMNDNYLPNASRYNYDSFHYKYTRENRFADFGKNSAVNQHEVILNPDTNTITVSSYNYFSDLGSNADYEFTSLSVRTYVDPRSDDLISVSLEEYGFEVIKDGDQFYIPLMIANQLFTNHAFDYVLLGDQLVMYVYGVAYKELDKLNNDNTRVINYRDSVAFLKLYFDHFSGRNFAYEQIDDVSGKKGFDEWLLQFSKDMDDPHTSPYAGVPSMNESSWLGSNAKLFESFYGTVCSGSKTIEEPLTAVGNTLFIKIDSFHSFDRKVVSAAVEQGKDYKNIIFDLRCNTGGYLQNMDYLLNLIPGVEYGVYELNLGGEKPARLGLFSNEEEQLNSDIYVLTSYLTYSAGNIFASIMKDNDVATIIGQDTMGGACIVDYLPLDSGYVLRTSSGECYTNSMNDQIDYGVTPDIELDGIFSEHIYENIIDELFTQQ